MSGYFLRMCVLFFLFDVQHKSRTMTLSPAGVRLLGFETLPPFRNGASERKGLWWDECRTRRPGGSRAVP